MRHHGPRRGGFLLSCYLLDIVAAATSCSSATLVSQEDANAISGCSTITGNIVLATNAAGSIALDGVHVIEGSLSTEACSSSSSCSGLVSLSSSTLSSVSQGLILQSFSSLVNITFPQIISTGPTFSLDDLPSLQNVSVPNLASAEEFHVSDTLNLTFFALDVLQNVTSVYVNNVALSTLPSIKSVSNITSFTVSGISNVSELTLNTPYIGRLEIQGNGSLGFSLLDIEVINNNTVKDSQVLSIDTLNLSGCTNIGFTSTKVTTFNGTGNNVTSFDLQQVEGLTNIYIIDNPLLQYIAWPKTPVLNNFTLSNNPLLNTAALLWQTLNITNLVLTGSFNDAYINALEPNFVLGDLFINGTGVVDCDPWNIFREQGHVLGNYSCQGTTVAIKSEAMSNWFRSGVVIFSTAFVTAMFCNL